MLRPTYPDPPNTLSQPSSYTFGRIKPDQKLSFLGTETWLKELRVCMEEAWVP